MLAVGGYRPEFEWAEDLDLFLRLGEVGKLANLPEVLLVYRQHLSSIGHSKRKIQLNRASRAIESACQRRSVGSRLPGKLFDADAEDSADGLLVGDFETAAAIHRKWAWLALRGGHPGTARTHAFRAVRLDPWRKANFNLIGCALRGR